MRKIYQFASQEHPERKTYYLFIIARDDKSAVYFANEKADIDNIPYVFGESDIAFNEAIGEMSDGCFELIETEKQ